MIVHKVVSKDRRSVIAKHPAFIRVYRKGVTMRPRKGFEPLLAFDTVDHAEEFIIVHGLSPFEVKIVKCEARLTAIALRRILVRNLHRKTQIVNGVLTWAPTNTFNKIILGTRWPDGTVFCTELTPLE